MLKDSFYRLLQSRAFASSPWTLVDSRYFWLLKACLVKQDDDNAVNPNCVEVGTVMKDEKEEDKLKVFSCVFSKQKQRRCFKFREETSSAQGSHENDSDIKSRQNVSKSEIAEVNNNAKPENASDVWFVIILSDGFFCWGSRCPPEECVQFNGRTSTSFEQEGVCRRLMEYLRVKNRIIRVKILKKELLSRNLNLPNDARKASKITLNEEYESELRTCTSSHSSDPVGKKRIIPHLNQSDENLNEIEIEIEALDGGFLPLRICQNLIRMEPAVTKKFLLQQLLQPLFLLPRLQDLQNRKAKRRLDEGMQENEAFYNHGISVKNLSPFRPLDLQSASAASKTELSPANSETKYVSSPSTISKHPTWLWSEKTVDLFSEASVSLIPSENLGSSKYIKHSPEDDGMIFLKEEASPSKYSMVKDMECDKAS